MRFKWMLLSLVPGRMAHGVLLLSRPALVVDQMFGSKFPGQFVSIPRHCFSIPWSAGMGGARRGR
jgi:hypothetical protein